MLSRGLLAVCFVVAVEAVLNGTVFVAWTVTTTTCEPVLPPEMVTGVPVLCLVNWEEPSPDDTAVPAFEVEGFGPAMTVTTTGAAETHTSAVVLQFVPES